jgi:RNA polymerase sigma factor (sigma-70 family)
MEPQPTDRELLAILAAEPAAFELFYRRHVDRVLGFSARRLRDPHDVADVVAATFLAVLTSASTYDPNRGEPGAWLLGIAARVIAGQARRADRDRALANKIAGRRWLGSNDIERLEERITAEQSVAGLMQVVDRLKPRDREALLLVGMDGLTPTQAAGVLGISPANFRMRLTAARRALAQVMPATRSPIDRSALTARTPS